MFRVNYVEIPVVDLDRAVACYEHLFAVTLERATIDGNQMALFPEVSDGANAALAMGDSYEPSADGSRIYATVAGIEELLGRAAELGLEVMYPRTSIGELGFVAEIRDSEGNRLALHEPL